MKRRYFLAAIGTAAIAGCIDDDDFEDDTDPDAEPEDDEPVDDDREDDEPLDVDETDDVSEADDATDDPAGAAYIDEVDETVHLAFGDTAELSNGVTITVLDIHFEEQLGDEDWPQEPDDGNQWALVELHGENTSDAAERLPLPWMDFALTENGTQYDTATVLDTDPYEEFEGGQVQPGIVREGVIVFEVPEGLDATDFEVVWYDDFLGANIDVRWSAG